MGQDYLKIKLVINEVNIPMVSRFVGDAVEPIGLTPRQAKLLCFAVETILELRMGHLPKEMPHVEIVVTKNLEDISVSVRDKGLPYVLTDRQRQIIANGLADNYRLDQLGSDGQRLTYILKTERSQELSIPEMKDEELLDDTLTVSPVRTDDEDINEAIRCLYAAYGYEYLHQALYQVEHFREVLLDGSFVPPWHAMSTDRCWRWVRSSATRTSPGCTRPRRWRPSPLRAARALPTFWSKTFWSD